MSFLASTNRPYHPLAHPDTAHPDQAHTPTQDRLPTQHLASFDDLPPPPFSPGSMVSNPSHPSHAPDRPHPTLPKVGETRCCEFIPTRLSDRSSIEPPFRARPRLRPANDRRHPRLGPSRVGPHLPLPRPCPGRALRGASRSACRQIASHLCPPGRASIGEGRPGWGFGEQNVAWERHSVSSVFFSHHSSPCVAALAEMTRAVCAIPGSHECAGSWGTRVRVRSGRTRTR